MRKTDIKAIARRGVEDVNIAEHDRKLTTRHEHIVQLMFLAMKPAMLLKNAVAYFSNAYIFQSNPTKHVRAYFAEVALASLLRRSSLGYVGRAKAESDMFCGGGTGACCGSQGKI